jgi:hypothetical protein
VNVRVARAFVLVLGCLLVTPAAAHAQFGRGWLERLSGPGPFTGLTVEARFLCLTAPRSDEPAETREVEQITETLKQAGGSLTYPKVGNGPVWMTGLGCHFLKQDRPRFEIGLQYSSLHSNDNVLDYSDRDSLSQADLEVDLTTFMVTADIRVNRVLDVGAAIGRASFSSDTELFPSFSRTMYQPMRLTTRPLAAFWSSAKAGVLLVQFDGTRFKGAFTAEDFGAVPGTYREPGEMNWTWSVKIDFTTLFWQ